MLMKRSKRGTKPTAAQKKILSANGMKCIEWLVLSHENATMIVKHRLTGTVRCLEGVRR